MKFRRTNRALAIVSGTSLLALSLLAGDYGQEASAQFVAGTGESNEASAKILVCNVIQGHSHAEIVLEEDLDTLAQIAGPDGAVPIETSESFNNRDFRGPKHTHVVNLRASHFVDLRNGKEVEIASESGEGHSHICRSVTKQECPGIFLPPPTHVPHPACFPGSFCYCQKFPGAPSCGFFCPPGSKCFCQRFPFAPICNDFCPVGSPCFCQKFPRADGCQGTTPPPTFTPPPPSPSPTPTEEPGQTPSPSPTACEFPPDVTTGGSVVEIPLGATNFGTMEIEEDTSVIWRNNDTVEHTITSDTGLFDSGPLRRCQTFSHSFDESGTYAYHCSIHPSETGVIEVTSSGAEAIPSPMAIPTETSTALPDECRIPGTECYCTFTDPSDPACLPNG